MSMFDKSFERVFKNEGGFQNDPKDRGNWTSGRIGVGQLLGTKYGISAMTYPTLDIRNLSYEAARAIYKRDWWDKLGMERYPQALQYQMFDAALNHGSGRANKMLQRAVGAMPDGIIGPNTRAKVAATDPNDLLLMFLSERLEFFTHVTTWDRFGKGWARRIAHNLKIAAQDN